MVTQRTLRCETYVIDQLEEIKKLERVKGIEPSFSAWEADVLPLNYTRFSGS